MLPCAGSSFTKRRSGAARAGRIQVDHTLVQANGERCPKIPDDAHCKALHSSRFVCERSPNEDLSRFAHLSRRLRPYAHPKTRLFRHPLPLRFNEKNASAFCFLRLLLLLHRMFYRVALSLSLSVSLRIAQSTLRSTHLGLKLFMAAVCIPSVCVTSSDMFQNPRNRATVHVSVRCSHR